MEQSKRKKPGPKKRHGDRQDIHLLLSSEVIQALDKVAVMGRSDYVEQVLRERSEIAEQLNK